MKIQVSYVPPTNPQKVVFCCFYPLFTMSSPEHQKGVFWLRGAPEEEIRSEGSKTAKTRNVTFDKNNRKVKTAKK